MSSGRREQHNAFSRNRGTSHRNFAHFDRWIRATLEKSGTAVEGWVYTYDEATNCVVLQSLAAEAPGGHGRAAKSGKFDFHILKVSALKDVAVTAPPASAAVSSPGDTSVLVPAGTVNVDKVIARENSAVKAEAQRVARIGVGVTKEAQHIFDALAKTMPCSWSGEQIVVLGQVAVLPPYGAENVHPIKGADATKHTLDRIRLVLTNEKKRLGLEAPTKA